MEHFALKNFKKVIDNKNQKLHFSGVTPSGKMALLNVQTALYAPQHDQC
jgi:hypothetical protein